MIKLQRSSAPEINCIVAFKIASLETSSIHVTHLASVNPSKYLTGTSFTTDAAIHNTDRKPTI